MTRRYEQPRIDLQRSSVRKKALPAILLLLLVQLVPSILAVSNQHPRHCATSSGPTSVDLLRKRYGPANQSSAGDWGVWAKNQREILRSKYSQFLWRICEFFVSVRFLVVLSIAKNARLLCEVEHRPLIRSPSTVILFAGTLSPLSSWKWSAADSCHPLVLITNQDADSTHYVLSRSERLTFLTVSSWTLVHRELDCTPFVGKLKVTPSSDLWVAGLSRG